MRLIKPSFEILEQEPGIQGIYKQIERAGRTCYKSEDRITEDSAEKFVNMIKDRQHTAMLEHGTVYLSCSDAEFIYLGLRYECNIYSNVVWEEFAPGHRTKVYITTNYRVLYENNWLDDLKYLCEPTEYHEKRITVKFICDRGVSHEFVRHRVFSFAQESTRYCNYSKDKFGKELTFIIPCWANTNKFPKHTIITHDDFGDLIGEHYFHLSGKEASHFKPWEITPESNFITSLQVSEQLYLELLNQGWTPQQARSVLPNSLKTELVMTGTLEQWKGFFKLRCDAAAHPQARELAIPLKEEFKKLHYIND